MAPPDRPAPILTARLGDDVAFLPQSQYYWYEDGWRKQPIRDEVRWHVFDDRAMYRPGEEVHIKGWVRRIGASRTATSPRCAARRPSGTKSPTWSATRSTPALSTSPSSRLDLAVNLPDNAALGYAQVNLQLVEAGDFEGTEYYHAFQIQEFRFGLEFEVTARPEGEGPYFVGGEATVGVHAAYFAGGPLPNAGANWNVTAQPGLYAPPNWPEFTFGTWTPWWRYSGWDDGQPRWFMRPANCTRA